jgi:hypothetical protein
MERRDFLAALAAPALFRPKTGTWQQSSDSWDQGSVLHLIPGVSDRRILLKASFRVRHAKPPVLRIARRSVIGRQTDSQGFFWSFDAEGLDASQEYTLELTDASRRALCDPWPLRTFPSPNDQIKQFRLLVYTCAGGDERIVNAAGVPSFLSLERRRKLLDRAMSFQPDAVVSNGDHIYWDLRQTGAPPNYSPDILASTGRFIRDLPVLGTQNENVLKRVAEEQIGKLYGVRFRSTPCFVLLDDHDYFENDGIDAFPPDHLMLQLGRATHSMYFPEFLPDAERPVGLPGSSAPDKPRSTSEAYGTIRFGTLAEVLLFDCRRYLSLTGPKAWIVPPETEQWLKTRAEDVRVSHLVNLSSMPPVWSAGKWGDWNPDVLGPDGKLTTSVAKPYWQSGWLSQHDRLMEVLSRMKGRPPIWISGDMHAHGEARLQRGGAVDLSKNPVNVFLSGALGTGTLWPSGARRTPPVPSKALEVDERLPALEENGFLIVDFTPEKVAIQFFRWLPIQGDAALETLQAFRVTELSRYS